MSNGLQILGGRNFLSNSGSRDADDKLFWRLEELENAYLFSMPSSPNVEPFFVEFDELTASGNAYQERGPLNIMDLLSTLEVLAPDYSGIILSDNARLIRQRLSQSPGLFFEISGTIVNCFKEDTLRTINFLDFYVDHLQPRIRGGLNGKNIIDFSQKTGS